MLSPCPCSEVGPSHMITTLPPFYKQQNMKSSVDMITIYSRYEYLVYWDVRNVQFEYGSLRIVWLVRQDQSLACRYFFHFA